MMVIVAFHFHRKKSKNEDDDVFFAGVCSKLACFRTGEFDL